MVLIVMVAGLKAAMLQNWSSMVLYRSEFLLGSCALRSMLLDLPGETKCKCNGVK